MSDKGHQKDTNQIKPSAQSGGMDNFVLEKGIFSNIFDKDIRRVYIYKKAERLAKAIHLIAPAFAGSPALRNRLDTIAVGLVDAATLPPLSARDALSRELLALSSVLAIAQAGGLISVMNAQLIARESHALLEDIATYEEPRLFLEEAPTLATLARRAGSEGTGVRQDSHRSGIPSAPRIPIKDTKGHSSESGGSDRRKAILDVLSSKGPSYIKDISVVIRDVSEKTIQRELSALVGEGKVSRKGERRWTTYELVS